MVRLDHLLWWWFDAVPLTADWYGLTQRVWTVSALLNCLTQFWIDGWMASDRLTKRRCGGRTSRAIHIEHIQKHLAHSKAFGIFTEWYPSGNRTNLAFMRLFKTIAARIMRMIKTGGNWNKKHKQNRFNPNKVALISDVRQPNLIIKLIKISEIAQMCATKYVVYSKKFWRSCFGMFGQLKRCPNVQCWPLKSELLALGLLVTAAVANCPIRIRNRTAEPLSHHSGWTPRFRGGSEGTTCVQHKCNLCGLNELAQRAYH